MALWPEISGNTINGLGDEAFRPPQPVFWRDDGESISHTKVLHYFFNYNANSPNVAKAREYRDSMRRMPVSDLAPVKSPQPDEGWVAAIKQAALHAGADDVGICEYRDEWTYTDRPRPKGRWTIVMAFQHDYDNLKIAPGEDTYIEVLAQYHRAGATAKKVASWIQERGFVAEAKAGPMSEDVIMIPAAIEAGLGELGKHGSMIHRKFGASFRLSMVTTDLPVEPDVPDIFGGDDFCQSCQVCTNACPPRAIEPNKQMVRGTEKWYVDFDKCLPFFVENMGCGICLAVCPWSRPGIADNLVAKMARRLPETAESR